MKFVLASAFRYPSSNCRDSIVVSTLRCGRNNPGSNPGHGTFFFHKSHFIFCLYCIAIILLFNRIGRELIFSASVKGRRAGEKGRRRE